MTYDELVEHPMVKRFAANAAIAQMRFRGYADENPNFVRDFLVTAHPDFFRSAYINGSVELDVFEAVLDLKLAQTAIGG